MKTLTKLVTITVLTASALAAATWNGGDGSDPTFSNGTNWVGGAAPASGTALVIDSSNFLGFDANFTAPSVTVNSGISADFTPLGSEALSLGSGGLIMNGTSIVFNLGVASTATSAWAINSGSVTFANGFDISSGLITITMAAGTNISFSSTPAWFGTGINFTGPGVTATSIDISNATNLSKLTINGAAATISGGQLTIVAVPEPSTYASLAGVMVLGFVAYRRRKVAAIAA